MTIRTEAIQEIITESRSRRRSSTAAAKRILKACKSLSLDDAETLMVFRILEYADRQGKPYNPAVEQVWKIPEAEPQP